MSYERKFPDSFLEKMNEDEYIETIDNRNQCLSVRLFIVFITIELNIYIFFKSILNVFKKLFITVNEEDENENSNDSNNLHYLELINQKQKYILTVYT